MWAEGAGSGMACVPAWAVALTDVFSEHGSCCAEDFLCTPSLLSSQCHPLLTSEDTGTELAKGSTGARTRAAWSEPALEHQAPQVSIGHKAYKRHSRAVLSSLMFPSQSVMLELCDPLTLSEPPFPRS